MSKWDHAARAAERGEKPSWQSDHRQDDLEFLQNQTRLVQKETLTSSQKALHRLNEAQQIGAQNLEMLNRQSEQLRNAEIGLDVANKNTKSVEAKVDYLKSLNRFFMIPAFGRKKAEREQEKFDKIKSEQNFKGKHVKEREKQWDARQQRLARNESSGNSQTQLFNTTPDGLERCEVETEIDSNLTEISSGLSRLKMMGLQMNEEMEVQQGQLRRINERSDKASGKLGRLQDKVEYVANGNRRVRK